MVAILAVFFTIFQQPGKEKSVPLTDLYQTVLNDAKNGNKDTVLINANKITVKSPEGTKTSPFCSDRCRLIDLGRWLDGRYQIPVAEPDESDQGAREDHLREDDDEP